MKPVSGARFCRVLDRAGWVRTGGKGSHRKDQAPDGRVVVVPVHKGKDL